VGFKGTREDDFRKNIKHAFRKFVHLKTVKELVWNFLIAEKCNGKRNKKKLNFEKFKKN
jgi:ferredoxin-fold anticodon binding domain-containing protein